MDKSSDPKETNPASEDAEQLDKEWRGKFDPQTPRITGSVPSEQDAQKQSLDTKKEPQAVAAVQPKPMDVQLPGDTPPNKTEGIVTVPQPSGQVVQQLKKCAGCGAAPMEVIESYNAQGEELCSDCFFKLPGALTCAQASNMRHSFDREYLVGVASRLAESKSADWETTHRVEAIAATHKLIPGHPVPILFVVAVMTTKWMAEKIELAEFVEQLKAGKFVFQYPGPA